MVALVRQPVAQVSAVDKISAAAIDALLEMPTKVDGMQGRFQAFEISVTTEAPPYVATPAAGAQNRFPAESDPAVTPPASELTSHGAGSLADPAGEVPPLNLSAADWIAGDLLTAAAVRPEDVAPFTEREQAAIDSVLGELSTEPTGNSFASPRLDMAAATLLAVIIGRALWQARAPKAAAEKEKTANQDAAAS
jgi:hypothetical protein